MSDQAVENEPAETPEFAKSKWAGHTHDYPSRTRKDGTRVCRDCGYSVVWAEVELAEQQEEERLAALEQQEEKP